MTQKTNSGNECGCACKTGCCGSETANISKNEEKSAKIGEKSLVIDFLYLDLSVCTRCQDTDSSLDEALTEVSKVLDATGIKVIVNKINVTSEELALKYEFVSSPTIRVNGEDIQMDFKESLCESCGDLCGDEVDCRVWIYQGQEFSAPPKAMIIEAILKEVYGGKGFKEVKNDSYTLPENLKAFYAALKNKK